MAFQRRQTANVEQSKAFFWPRDSPNIGGRSAVIDVNDSGAGGEWSRQQIGPRALADSDDPITPARSERKFQLTTNLVRRLNQAMPGYDDGLHAREAGWKSGHDSCGSVMAMDDVGAGAPKRSVQAADQVKKRGRMMENYLKPLGLQLFAKHADPV